MKYGGRIRFFAVIQLGLKQSNQCTFFSAEESYTKKCVIINKKSAHFLRWENPVR